MQEKKSFIYVNKIHLFVPLAGFTAQGGKFDKMHGNEKTSRSLRSFLCLQQESCMHERRLILAKGRLLTD